MQTRSTHLLAVVEDDPGLRADLTEVLQLRGSVLLFMLFRIPGEAIPRDQLLARMGKPDTLSNLRNLDNAVSRIRRKVLQACGVDLPV
ncbi:MAG: winged helix-turn-helix domain-containing protein, partial [Sulfuritalea sp.]|nr:winged helix-turn-helix domain-containing protein [Sulfuritalea sp.]